MYKLAIFAAILAVALAVPTPADTPAKTDSVKAKRSLAYGYSPLSYRVAAPVTYTAPLTYSAPITYSTYSAPLHYHQAPVSYIAPSYTYSGYHSSPYYTIY